MNKREHGAPSQPPEMDRRLSFKTIQLIGMPLILLLPFLAFFGLAGPQRNTVTVVEEGLEIHLDYPTILRRGASSNITISIIHQSETHRNLSETPKDQPGIRSSEDSSGQFRISFPDEYMSPFTRIRFHGVEEIRAGREYVVTIEGIQPGEMRKISVEMDAEFIGRPGGWVTFTLLEENEVQIPVSTVVLP